MAIDTSIYGNIRQPEFESPVNALAKVTQLQNAQSQNRLAQLTLADKQRETDGDNALAGLLAGGGDSSAVAKGLAEQGFGAKSLAYSKQAAEMTKQQREAEKAQLESAIQKQGIVAQYAGSAKDQQSWTAAKQALAGMGIDVSQVPDQYDPATAQTLLQRSLTGVQQLEQTWKSKQFDLDERKFGETVRNNKIQNSIAQGNLGLRRQELDQKKDALKATDGKPLPTAALKLVQEDLDAIGTASSIKSDLGTVLKQLDTGKLNVSGAGNLINKARNTVGLSTEESRNFASFQATLEKLRNDSLRLNKGVQTDGDAQRAWDELFNNINDKGVVKQRLQEIQKINERAVNLRKNSIDSVRANYGKGSLDTSAFENQPSALGGNSSSNIDSLLDKYK